MLGSKGGAEAMEDFFPAELDEQANGLIQAAIKVLAHARMIGRCMDDACALHVWLKGWAWDDRV